MKQQDSGARNGPMTRMLRSVVDCIGFVVGLVLACVAFLAAFILVAIAVTVASIWHITSGRGESSCSGSICTGKKVPTGTESTLEC